MQARGGASRVCVDLDAQSEQHCPLLANRALGSAQHSAGADIGLLVRHSTWQSSARNEEGVSVANGYPVVGCTFVTLAVSGRECVFSTPFAVAWLDCYFRETKITHHFVA